MSSGRFINNLRFVRSGSAAQRAHRLTRRRPTGDRRMMDLRVGTKVRFSEFYRPPQVRSGAIGVNIRRPLHALARRRPRRWPRCSSRHCAARRGRAAQQPRAARLRAERIPAAAAGFDRSSDCSQANSWERTSVRSNLAATHCIRALSTGRAVNRLLTVPVAKLHPSDDRDYGRFLAGGAGPAVRSLRAR
jgi:hypothetical protein